MDEPSYRVRDLLPSDWTSVSDRLARNWSEAPPQPGVPGFVWDLAGRAGADALRRSLDIDVLESVARGWAKALELRRYADRTKHPPDETITVFLGKHDVVAKFHPELHVSMGAVALPRLRFTLELAAVFRAAQLSIRDGHIVALGAGDCAVTAQLKYGDVNLHNKLQSRTVTLGTPRDLPKPGWAIG